MDVVAGDFRPVDRFIDRPEQHKWGFAFPLPPPLQLPDGSGC
jgi:hypothetical protein